MDRQRPIPSSSPALPTMRSSAITIALACLSLLLATQVAAKANAIAPHKTVVTQNSPTNDVTAFHKARPVVTPVRAVAKHSTPNNDPQVPAPAEQYAEIPETTPRPQGPPNRHQVHPAATRPLYPKIPKGTAPKPGSHNVAS